MKDIYRIMSYLHDMINYISFYLVIFSKKDWNKIIPCFKKIIDKKCPHIKWIRSNYDYEKIIGYCQINISWSSISSHFLT